MKIKMQDQTLFPEDVREMQEDQKRAMEEKLQQLEEQVPRSVMAQAEPPEEIVTNLEAGLSRARPIAKKGIVEGIKGWYEELEKRDGADATSSKLKYLVINALVFSASLFLVSPIAEYVESLH